MVFLRQNALVILNRTDKLRGVSLNVQFGPILMSRFRKSWCIVLLLRTDDDKHVPRFNVSLITFKYS